MITKDNYSEEHIRQLQIESKRDPGLIERSLFAFGLLEALAISTLIDKFSDFSCVYDTYYAVSETEIIYRDKKITPADALLNTIRAAMCIGSRGKVMSDDFPFYLKGTRDVIQHIYASGFNME